MPLDIMVRGVDGARKMETRSFIPPAERVVLIQQISAEEWDEHAHCKFVAIAGDSARILAGDNDEVSLIERMEVDPSVQSFFVTRCRAFVKRPKRLAR